MSLSQVSNKMTTMVDDHRNGVKKLAPFSNQRDSMLLLYVKGQSNLKSDVGEIMIISNKN